MTTQHTPGPWTTDGKAETDTLDIVSPLGRITLIDCEFSDESEDVLTANARLISAAPDLLDVVKELYDLLSHYCDDDPSSEEWETLKAARAAIAKATGESA